MTEEKEFRLLTRQFTTDLRSAYIAVEDESLSLIRIAGEEGWTFIRLQKELENLWDDAVVIKAAEKKKPTSAAFERARLESKYGWTGKKYGGLIKQIIAENQAKLGFAMLTTDQKRFEKNAKSILPVRDHKQLVFPDISNVLRRSSVVIKAAENGRLMAETKREEMRKLITRVLVENDIQTKSGTIRKDISKKMEAEMVNFYTNYTKKDPKLSVPKNIHSIAVTETYSTLNKTRLEYAREVNRSNDLFQVMKTWKHNSSMSKVPRAGHKFLNGTTVPIDKKFTLIGENKRTYYIDGPYDGELPPEEVITCSCELVFKTVRIKKD